MGNHRVVKVIDGDTFEVDPGFKLRNGSRITRVRPARYNAPELHEFGGDAAKRKLSRLILGKVVKLDNPQTVHKGRLVCDVYINGRNLASYFSKPSRKRVPLV